MLALMRDGVRLRSEALLGQFMSRRRGRLLKQWCQEMVDNCDLTWADWPIIAELIVLTNEVLNADTCADA
jgi:hypothetical protein